MNPESMLKGRMAETLFEELMRQSGNIVYRFGYEAIVQNLTQLEEKFDRYSDVGERIRAIPDFIVVDSKGRPVFVEVKFRQKAEMSSDKDAKRLEMMHKYWDTQLVVVNCWKQPYFQVCDPPYLKNKQLNLRPLLDEKEWRIPKDIYEIYEGLVDKYLKPTLVFSKK